MILRSVRDALRKRRQATVSQLIVDARASRAMVDAAVAYWERRGAVSRRRGVPEGCSPGACATCPLVPLCHGEDADATAEYLEWVEPVTVR